MREGGNDGVVPVVVCQGVQNRPPWTKSPSPDEIALPVPEYPPARRKATKTPSKVVRYGEENRLVFKIDGEVLRIVQCGTHYGDF